MLTRRQFLGSASVLAAASLVAPTLSWASEHRAKEIGLQLWSVKDLLKADFEGTVTKVAAMGYKEVEFFDYFGHTAKQVRAILDKHQLKSPSCHVRFDMLFGDKWLAQIESAKTIGQSYLVNPWIPEEKRKTIDDWKRAAEVFNKAGAIAKKAGIQFAYHNHYFEFLELDHKVPYDVLLDNSDPSLVKMELDIAWIIVGGKDPVACFEKYKGRFPLVHVKDIKKVPSKVDLLAKGFALTPQIMTEVGAGIIDWKRILGRSDVAGIKHYIVEYEGAPDPFAAVKNSLAFVRKLEW